MIPVWPPTKVAQTGTAGCISRSRGQGFPDAVFKNLNVRNLKAQSFHIRIVDYPTVHYSAMLRYVPWAIWLGKSRNHE